MACCTRVLSGAICDRGNIGTPDMAMTTATTSPGPCYRLLVSRETPKTSKASASAVPARRRTARRPRGGLLTGTPPSTAELRFPGMIIFPYGKHRHFS